MLVPPDLAAGGARCGEGDAVVHGDLEGVGLDGDVRDLACMWEAYLDPLAADHDRAADGTRRRTVSGGQPWWPGGCGAGSAKPVPGGLRDRACS
jgi:hypothetical protein